MLCPTCEMAYGDTVEGPWISCGHDGMPTIRRPAAGIFQMLWNPILTLDYLRIVPSLPMAFAIFVPFTLIQVKIFFARPHFHSLFAEIPLRQDAWMSHITHFFWSGPLGLLIELAISFLLIAGTLHITATLLGGRGRFQSILSATLFIETMIAWKVLFPTSNLWVLAPFWGVENTLLILSVARLYGLRMARAFWARVLAVLIQVALLFFYFITISTIRTLHQRGSLFSPREPTIEHVDIATDLSWTVQGLDGRSYSLQQLRGDVTVVNVWATWCGPCRSELPSLEKLSQAVQGSSIHVIEISEESPDVVARFLRRHPYQLSFYTRDAGLPSDFQSEGIPATFILDPQGHIVAKTIGSARWNDPKILDYLQSLSRK